MNILSATNVNHCLELEVESSYSWKDWIRLRDTWNAVVTSQSLIHKHSEQLENIVLEESRYRNYASDIQNRQIMLQILERDVNKARELVRTARYQLNTSIYALNQMNEMFKSQEEDASRTGDEVSELDTHNADQRLELKQLRNELVFRRRHMLKTLYEVFFPKMKSCSRTFIFKKQSRLGHNDVELSSAAGFIVLLLLSIGHILDCPLKHLLIFYGSRSSIINLSSMERFELCSTSARSHRNRLDQAMHMLTEVIVQLRTESGVMSKETDRPVRLVQELLLSYIGFHRFHRSDLLIPYERFSNALQNSLPIYICVKTDKIIDDSKLFY
uniref:Uncharacterized protein n=1 Tax=Globodera rostochiensis TaxID=31243 RepID=A0A914GWK6_GLORO